MMNGHAIPGQVQQPPADPSNNLLAMTPALMILSTAQVDDSGDAVKFDEERYDAEQLKFIISSSVRASAIPSQIGYDGRSEKRLIWTIWGSCNTFTVFITATQGRQWITEIRDLLSAEMPLIVMPPEATKPTPAGPRMILDFQAPNGRIIISLEPTQVAEWADVLERGVMGLSGLEIPR
jgi:hypothetical protein